LDKIQAKINIQTDKETPVDYIVILYPSVNDPYIPNPTVEQEIIKKFVTDGVIKETEERSDFQILDEKSNNPKSAGFHYYLKVNRPKFNNLYGLFKKLVEQYEIAETIGNTLTFYGDGRVVYISPQGKEYKASFGTKTNSFLLLQFLIKNPHELFSFDKLAEHLNPARSHSNSPSNERRVRDTIQAIKNKLLYHGDDLFISGHGFGLNCDVSIRK